MSRMLTALVLALALVFSLSACGKKGPPKPPSEDSVFPQSYPTQ